jgi:hypothetical protein
MRRSSAREGGTPQRDPLLSNFQREVRDRLIAQRSFQGWSLTHIAEESGLSKRRCQEIIRRERATPGLLERDPVPLVEWLLREHECSFRLYLVAACQSDSTSASVGALHGAATALARIRELLVEVGALPENLRAVGHERDLRRLTRETLVLTAALRQGEIDAGTYERRP